MPVMLSLTMTLALAAATLAVLTAFQVAKAPAWSSRGIDPVIAWPYMSAIQISAALASVALTYPTWGTIPAVCAATFVWVGILAVGTDLKTCKVPYEVAHPVAVIGLAGFAMNYTIEGALALGAATVGVVGIPLVGRFLTNKGLGMSDVRLLWAVTATTSWWVGQTWLLFAIIAACLVQIPVRIICHTFNWGQMVPTHPDREPEAGQPVKTRRELPFAPALVACLIGLILYGTYTGYGACLQWNVLGTCTVTV